jgi:hypothetical protein
VSLEYRRCVRDDAPAREAITRQNLRNWLLTGRRHVYTVRIDMAVERKGTNGVLSVALIFSYPVHASTKRQTSCPPDPSGCPALDVENSNVSASAFWSQFQQSRSDVPHETHCARTLSLEDPNLTSLMFAGKRVLTQDSRKTIGSNKGRQKLCFNYGLWACFFAEFVGKRKVSAKPTRGPLHPSLSWPSLSHQFHTFRPEHI